MSRIDCRVAGNAPRNDVRQMLLLIITGILCYANTFRVPFQFDDLVAIGDNRAIFNSFNFQAIWNYWPTRFITYLSFALNYHFHQGGVSGYHAMNLAIHLANTLLVWTLLRLLFRAPALSINYAKTSPPPSPSPLEGEGGGEGAVPFFAALLFAVHPIQTQAITYIYQRGTCLATLFCLTSFVLYLKSRLIDVGINDTGVFCSAIAYAKINRKIYYGLSLLTALLAMFTKEISITLPLMIAAVELFFFDVPVRRRWALLLPFLILLSVIPITAVLNRALTVAALTGVEGGQGSGAGFISQHDYILTQARGLLTSVRLLIIPVGQNVDYDYPLARSFREPLVAAGFGLFAAWILATIISFRKHRLVSFGLLWFLLTLLPQASIIPKPDLFVEHRLYLPSIGFFIALTALVLAGGKKQMRVAAVILLIAAAALGIGTFKRNSIWRTRLILWDDTVRKSPGKMRPYFNRGLAYAGTGNYADAIADYSTALRLNPAYAKAYCNRGVVYVSMKDYPKAIADYNAALRLNPTYVDAYSNRGVAYAMLKEYGRAYDDFAATLRINPSYPPAYNNRGITDAATGDLSRAITDFTEAIRFNPYYAEAYKNRGGAYLLLGKYAAAYDDYTAALRLNPVYARELKPLLEFARGKMQNLKMDSR